MSGSGSGSPARERQLSKNKELVGKQKYVLPSADKSKIRWKLDVIENFYPPHPSVNEALQKCIAHGVHEYPYPDERYQSLLQRIVDYCNEVQDGLSGRGDVGASQSISAKNITLTNGSDTAIEIIFRAITPPGATVLLPVPTFPQVELFLELLDCNIVRIRASHADDLMKLPFDNVDVTYITTPNLPLGYQLTRAQIATLARKYPATWFIVDEAYYEFGGVDTSAPLVSENQNVIVLRTFSKAFALAGLRIGYFLAHAETTRLIAPLINDKSVNTLSIWAADAALQNRDYYFKIALDMESQKEYLGYELEKIGIVKSQASIEDADNLPIYAYRMSGGAFFLLFCRNPARVCEIFAEHGIMIRNKNADWKDSVRVTLGPRHIMDDVLKVCRFINVKYLFALRRQGTQVVKPVVSFDLDLTLRDGSTSSAPLYPGAEIVTMVDARIITNNNCIPDEVSEYFRQNGFNIPSSSVITSLSSAKEFLIQGNLTAYILGDSRILPYFIDEDGVHLYTNTLDKNDGNGDNGGNGDRRKEAISHADCIFMSWINITFRDIADICNALAEGKVLIYTDMSDVCAVKSSSEFGSLAMGRNRVLEPETRIPDMQSIINIIAKASPEHTSQIICVGKPSMTVPPNHYCGVLIGDTVTDQEQADEFDAQFILVGQGKNGYNWDRNCIEFASIGQLYQAVLE